MNTARVRVSVGQQQQSITPYWFNNHEGSDALSKYDAISCTGDFDFGIQQAVAHSGTQALFATIDTSVAKAGVRFTNFMRNPPDDLQDFYYSVWMYIPVKTTVRGYWNVFQFKGRHEPKGRTDPAIAIRLDNDGPNGALKPHMQWNGEYFGASEVQYNQSLVLTPIGQWFHLEAFLHQASDMTGRVIVWQDGVRLWDVQNIQTKYPTMENGQTWAFNNYSNGLSPSPHTAYFDDVVIARQRVYGKTVIGL